MTDTPQTTPMGMQLSNNSDTTVARLIGLLCFLGLSLFAVHVGAATILDGYPKVNQVTRVDDQGRITVVNLSATGTGSGSLTSGSDSPKTAPNGKLVAFIRKNDLWILDLDSKVEQQITRDGAPFADPYLAVRVQIMGWAPKSDRILYSVNAVEATPDFDLAQKLKLRNAKYGIHVYDLKRKHHTKLDTEQSKRHQFVAWLTDDVFLVVGGFFPNQQLMTWNWINNTTSSVGSAPAGRYNQIAVSYDRKLVVAQYAEEGLSFRLLRIDLDKHEVKEIASSVSNARISPSGQNIAYLVPVHGPGGGIRGSQLMVDNKIVWPRGGSFEWVNDDLIAVKNLCGLTIVDAAKRQRVAYYPDLRDTSHAANDARVRYAVKCE